MQALNYQVQIKKSYRSSQL